MTGKKFITLLGAASIAMSLTGCDNVPAGYVGVQVERYGDDRGVNVNVLNPGRHYSGLNIDMYLFPTFTQTNVWDKAGDADESFTFQSIEGMSLNADVGISYYIKKENASTVFQKYRKGVDEITNTVLRTKVQDALNKVSSTMQVESLYGAGKVELQSNVEKIVKATAAKDGITVDNVYFVGNIRLPEQVMRSVNAKIAATQIAQQKENELRAAEADAAKAIAIAKGEAEAVEIKARALRENPQVLQQMAIEKWDGKLPQYSGGPLPFVKIN